MTLVAGCSGAPDAETVSGATAAVDNVNGVVRLPLDAYLPTETERNVFTYATEVEAARCAETKSVTYRPIRREVSTADIGFGVWQQDYAQRHGYDKPPSEADEALEDRMKSMSEAENQVVYDCMVRPETAEVKYPSKSLATMPFLRELTLTRPVDTQQGRTILGEWRGCLRDQGITPPGLPAKLEEYDWTPPEVWDMTREDQFRTAATDVGCKEKVRLVQRLADLQAGMQQRMISEHGAELAAFRDLWKKHLVSAQKAIDAYTRI